MVVSIGAVASAAQGVSYYERDGYYAKDDAAHREASAWFGKGAAALGLEGTVDPDLFTDILAGEVPDGSGLRLGRRNREGEIEHRPGRDLTFSTPKSVSLAALIGGDERIVGVHDAAVRKALTWIEANAAETRMRDPEMGCMVRVGGQSIVAATFRHDTSRNLDPQLHTHAVVANMVQGGDGGTPRSGKWRTMANERLYASKMLIGALYRAELARGLEELGYAVEKTHADGRFEIAGVPRPVIDAFSTRRAEIEAAMEARGLGDPAANPRVAERAALMTRSHKRDVDKEALRETWQRQAADLGFEARDLVSEARHWQWSRSGQPVASAGREREAGKTSDSDRAAAWAVAHLSEREAVFARTDLLTATLAWSPGKVNIEEAEAAVGRMEKEGTLHAARTPVLGDALTTDKALIDETETIALMERGQGRSKPVMRKWIAVPLLHNGRLTQGQKEAVTMILSSKDRVVGVQGYAGTGKTAMLDRARSLAVKSGWRMVGLAPSASAAATLGSEAGIKSETLQRFLARNAGVAEGRLKPGAERRMRASFRKTVLVVDEGSLASTVQARDLLRIADRLRIPRVVLVGDEKQLDAVDAGTPFAQLQRAGMQTVVMDEILRQKDPALKEAVRASLAGDVRAAFGKLGESVAEVKADNLAGAAAARWLRLSPEERQNTGLMAPSHAMRQTVNGHIRERLAREGVIHGPALEGERLASRGYTTAEKMQAANYAPGDVVTFHRAYRSLGVEKGEERRVLEAGTNGVVMLESAKGEAIPWRPRQVGASRGAVEVYRAEPVELRAGDRIRWTRNDATHGLVNSHRAEVTAVQGDRVSFVLEDGRKLELVRHQPQLRHLDHAWASTVHAFQGRTVDNVIAVMEANHPHLTTQKSFYVEISRARHRAELVTDDAKALCDRLEAATGERVSALEAVAAAAAERAKDAEQARQAAAREAARSRDSEIGRDKPAREAAELRTPAPARSSAPGIEPEAPPGKPEGTQGPRPVRTPEPERDQPPAPAPRPVRTPEPAKAPAPAKERAPRTIEYELELEL